MRNIIITTIISLLILNTAVYSQSSDKRQFILADDYIDVGNYQKALEIYDSLLSKDIDNANLNFKMGYCYLNTKLNKHKAIPYLEKAVKNVSEKSDPSNHNEKNAPIEAFFELGRAYRFNYQFKQAIDTLSYLLKTYTNEEEDVDFIKLINREIQICRNGIELTANPIGISVTNLGSGINSTFDEHSPVFSADESVMIFTSKRQGTGIETTSDGQFYEDIYISYKKDNNWTDPQSISPFINTTGHEASIGLSVDGQDLFIYKDDNGDGNIYISQLNGDVWTVPVKLGPTINTKSRETHASLSSDGITLYFTSNREGGYGGMDIYVSKKLPTGEWGEAKNLGPQINTEYNEEGPFIHPDGVTLFFSSQGHKTIGEYDIFTSTLNEENNSWSEPINIGYPINTTEDDVFYVPTTDGNRAYYATQNTEGFGKSDIFLLNLPEKDKTPLIVMTGKVFDNQNNTIANTIITVTNAESKDIVGTFTPNSKTGKYLFILDPGKNYHLKYEAPDFKPFEETIFAAEDSSFQKLQRAILLKTVILEKFNIEVKANKPIKPIKETEQQYLITKNYPTETIVPCNIIFEFNKVDPDKISPELDTLAMYLLKNPEAKIEIGGHADSQGPEPYNLSLSMKRALFAYNYLLKKGVKKECMITKGYGESIPIAINTNADGTYNKESQRFNRRVEFKVIKQGKNLLLIKQINVPDEFKIKNIVE